MRSFPDVLNLRKFYRLFYFVFSTAKNTRFEFHTSRTVSIENQYVYVERVYERILHFSFLVSTELNFAQYKCDVPY